jgi:hypothetical protein
MSKLELSAKDLIEPDANELKTSLLAGDYIICCSMSDPTDLETIVLENVIALKDSIPGKMDCPAIVEFGISSDAENIQYRLHDGLVVPLLREDLLDRIVTNMLKTFDLFIRDNGHVNRTVIYGKLQSEHQDEVVYMYRAEK